MLIIIAIALVGWLLLARLYLFAWWGRRGPTRCDVCGHSAALARGGGPGIGGWDVWLCGSHEHVTIRERSWRSRRHARERRADR